MKFVVELVGHGEDFVLGHQPVYQMLRKNSGPQLTAEQAASIDPLLSVSPPAEITRYSVSMLSGFRGRRR